jgi:hypothetical protein
MVHLVLRKPSALGTKRIADISKRHRTNYLPHEVIRIWWLSSINKRCDTFGHLGFQMIAHLQAAPDETKKHAQLSGVQE